MINMIKKQREDTIVSLLDEQGRLSVREIAGHLPDVSQVTVRRAIAELARAGRVERTHGGARPAARREPDGGAGETSARAAAPDSGLEAFDAIILPPARGRGTDALRNHARRRRMIFLAESAPQTGGVYVGPDNRGAGYALGTLAGRQIAAPPGAATEILIVSHDILSNTRERAEGFEAGLREAFSGEPVFRRINGQGNFKQAYDAACDAFRAHPHISVAFGVNDHSILAALEAARLCGCETVSGYSVGVEGAATLSKLAEADSLKACAALFPEIVGITAIDLVAGALGGATLPAEAITPHAVITPETLGRYYEPSEAGWTLKVTAVSPELSRPPAGRHGAGNGTGRRPVIGFMPHYPAHDWYRNMIRAMQERCDRLGMSLQVTPPQAGIAREITALRRSIAASAATRVSGGDTILLNGGEASILMARALRETFAQGPSGVTVITNSLAVMEILTGAAGIKVILTGGEYQAQSRCLVGPSLGAMFELMRADKAFLSVDGISARFGASAGDERLALAGHRFAQAAREVYVLADHTLVGFDANYRISRTDAVGEVITDSGSLPADRLALGAAGVTVTVADEAAIPFP